MEVTGQERGQRQIRARKRYLKEMFGTDCHCDRVLEEARTKWEAAGRVIREKRDQASR